MPIAVNMFAVQHFRRQQKKSVLIRRPYYAAFSILWRSSINLLAHEFLLISPSTVYGKIRHPYYIVKPPLTASLSDNSITYFSME